MIAFILVNTCFSEEETRSSKIGIFTPWLKVTKHLASYFSLSQWYDHKNKEENPWDYLKQAFGSEWKNKSFETFAKHFSEHPHQIRSILHIQTSITSASTTVTHALVIIPKHTKFTNNWAQGLVCLSRAQGTNFLFCPPRPPAGFFRYILPLLHRKQDSPTLTTITPKTVLQALCDLSTLDGQSSRQCYLEHSLYDKQPLGDWPLAILLSVQQDLGVPGKKTTLAEHLLLAQIPIRLAQEEPPLLEWRIAPSSAQNKELPEVLLSQVYLTFARSKTSPNNLPTFRLWLAGSIQGQHPGGFYSHPPGFPLTNKGEQLPLNFTKQKNA
jgi:hypothetical protein